MRLHAANRQRAVRLKNEREKTRNKQSNDMFSVLSSYDNDRKHKQRKKDKSKSKHKKHTNAENQKSIKTKQVQFIFLALHNNTKWGFSQNVVFSEDEDIKHNENEEKDVGNLQLVKSEIIELNNSISPNTTPSVCSEITTSSISTSTNIASTIMEYGASFSVIRSDKEDDDENETKMSMVVIEKDLSNAVGRKAIANAKKSKRARNKLKKLKKKNKNKIVCHFLTYNPNLIAFVFFAFDYRQRRKRRRIKRNYSHKVLSKATPSKMKKFYPYHRRSVNLRASRLCRQILLSQTKMTHCRHYPNRHRLK